MSPGEKDKGENSASFSPGFNNSSIFADNQQENGVVAHLRRRAPHHLRACVHLRPSPSRRGPPPLLRLLHPPSPAFRRSRAPPSHLQNHLVQFELSKNIPKSLIRNTFFGIKDDVSSKMEIFKNRHRNKNTLKSFHI